MAERIRRALRRVATPLAGAVLLAVIAVSLVARAPSVDVAGEGALAPAKSAADSGVELRSLPLLSPRGVVARGFADRTALTDVGLVRAVADRLGGAAGLGPAMPSLWTGIEPGTLQRQPRFGEVAYPYAYPSLERLRAAVSPAVVAREHDRLLELAGLLVLAAANADPVDGPLRAALPAAEVILEAVASDSGARDCDAQLSRAWAVSLGSAVTPKIYDPLFERAVAACPDDPTARWLWGHRQVEDALAPVNTLTTTRTEAMARPIRFFEQWILDEPASALARAGLGDALLTQAQALHDLHVMPFTVRAYARRATTTFADATAVLPRPEFALGRAQAASLLGVRSAVGLVDRAAAQRPRSSAFRQVGALVHESARDWVGTAVQATAEVDQPDPLRVVPSSRLTGRPAWWGAADATVTTLYDTSADLTGAGFVDWLGFVPDFRDDATVGPISRDPACRPATALRAVMLAGDLDRARELAGKADACVENTSLTGVLDVAQGRRSAEAGPDDVQNFWRYGGDLDRAAAAASTWRDRSDSPLASQRLGEIRYLQGERDPAAADLQRAVAGLGTRPDEEPRLRALLVLGLVAEKDGRRGDALATYATILAGRPDDATLTSAQERTGVLLLRENRTSEALPHLEAAAAGALRHDQSVSPQGPDVLDADRPPSSGAEYGAYAAALLDLDASPAKAVTFARRALALDPQSPVFRDLLAQALEAAGLTAEAEKVYQQATSADTTVFQAQNNLAVIAGSRGDSDRAERRVRSALRAEPDYALGWFNLGVVLSRSWSPVDLVHAQGAFARAVSLDPGLRGATATLTPDRSVVDTGLDVSRPVAAGWTFGSTASSPVTGLSWVLVALALLRLAYSLGLDQVAGAVSGRLLSADWHDERRSSRWWRRLDRLTGPAVALLGCAVVCAWPLLGAEDTGSLPQVVLVVGVLALVWLTMTIGRPHAAVPRRGWTPGLVLGGLTATIGYTFVPVPVDERESSSARTRWAPMILLGSVAATGLLLGWLTNVPLTRAIGVAALAMLSTSLLPMRPFDGAFLDLRRRHLEVVISLTLLAVSACMALGWL